MNFSVRLALSIAVLVTCTAVMGVAALWTMNQQHALLEEANDRSEELRGLYEIGSRASSARLLLNSAAPDPAEVRRQLLGAVQATDRLLHELPASPHASSSHLRAALENMRSSLESSLVAEPSKHSDDSLRTSSAALNSCLSNIAALSAEASNAIARERQDITDHVERAQWMLGVTLVVTLILAVVLGWTQHRAVARPLLALRRGVERIAQRQMDQPIVEAGPREFRVLIRQFNDMSRDIRALEESLNRQVESKSRQLIRSERLAGLGYLAAGLAHEINNPLGVIGGYAETMLRRIDAAAPDGAEAKTAHDAVLHDLADALRTISEEVFRCQDITTGLLQMTRPGEGQMDVVEIRSLVSRVTNMLRRLPLCGERQLLLEEPDAVPLVTRGHRGQLTQVLVNLITNALEATEPHTGVVRVTIAAQAGSALIRVADNGCGMSEETLAHVFDPLFTDKPRRGLTGFGLGLSVSLAIIERHGGRVDASSPGPGRGSTFVIELPAMSAATADEALETA